MKRFIEPLFLLAISAAFIAVSMIGGKAVVVATGEASLAWRQLAFVYGIAFVLLAVISYGLGHLNRSLVECTRTAIANAFNGQRRVVRSGTPPLNQAFGPSVLVAALAIGFWLRWQFIDQPLRLDEAYSFLAFVNSSWTNVFLYAFPNNHVLNSILERLSVAIGGPDPIAIRLPAFVFGLAAIGVAYRLARRLGNECGGALAALGVAVWPYLVLYSTNGRGYSLVAFLVVIIACVAIDDSGNLRRSRVLAASVLSALGMITIPSMLFAVAGLLAWMTGLMWIQTRDGRSVAADLIGPFLTLFVSLTVLLYSPVALVSGGLQGVMANKEATALPFARFAHQAMPHVEHTARALSADVPLSVVLVLCGLAILGMYWSLRRRNFAAALLLPCIVCGAAVVFLLKRSIPFPRTWIFFIPVFLVAADVGAAMLAARCTKLARWLMGGVLLAATLVFARDVVVREAILANSETGISPSAETIAVKLTRVLAAGDQVCALVPENIVLAYHLWRNVEPSKLQQPHRVGRVFWIHKKPSGPTRGAQAGWRTVVESDHLMVDQWASETPPQLMQIRGMDCWRPDIETRRR